MTDTPTDARNRCVIADIARHLHEQRAREMMETNEANEAKAEPTWEQHRDYLRAYLHSYDPLGVIGPGIYGSIRAALARVGEGGAAEARRYYRVARRRFPELKANGYLDWLWRTMFAWE